MKAGHQTRRIRALRAKSREALAKDGATAAASLADVVKTLGQKPRAVWLMLPAGRSPKRRSKASAACLERDDIVIDGGNSFYKDDIRRAKTAGRKGNSLRRLRHVGRRLGHRARLLHDDWRSKEAVDHLDPIFSALAPGTRRYPAHARARERRYPRRARLHSRRSVRCRALRQDGAQRHRVRIDAGLRRRLRHPAQQGFEATCPRTSASR